jgi:hypothetical protein
MSSVRLRIVINDSNRTLVRWDELVVLLRRAWEELIPGLRQAVASVGRQTRYAFCGLRGHDDRLRAERNHLALSCERCGRVTTGWDLTRSSRPYASPSRRYAREAGPRYFEMARRRS